ncbi:SUKH-3 domain-containing protein [Paenibacillus sp. P36]|uniref:SUKH-3 domain-containing protein n=1 Tax=Paenibacillus sp. P36 TaxID=3342538 RepID=UPI0038B3C628
MLNQTAFEVMMKSGWSLSRKISINHYEQALKNELYIFYEHAAVFLSQFGGLKY